jgi:hypothetical protein
LVAAAVRVALSNDDAEQGASTGWTARINPGHGRSIRYAAERTIDLFKPANVARLAQPPDRLSPF